MFNGDRSYVSYTPDLPLAMYRELSVHLAQVEGISTELIWQDSKQFNYSTSQIAGMWIQYASPLPEQIQNRVLAILDGYGTWQLQKSAVGLSEIKS